MAPTTIPADIWMKTAEFIPSDILRNLYSVNAIFLHLALNDKYSSVQLGKCWTAQTAKYLKHLNLPHIARRVKRLTLLSHWLDWNMLSGSSKKITLRTRLGLYLPFKLGWFIDPELRRISNIKMCNTLMHNTVLNFPNVTSLVIIEGYRPSQPDPLILDLYATYALNLRSLSLYARSPNFNFIFPPNASNLTALEEVALSFLLPDSCRVDSEIVSIFFRAIAFRLTTLKITLRRTSDVLLQILPDIAFPKLTSFYLESPASPSPYLNQFLNQHADTLIHLHLLYKKLPQSLRLPVLPRLKSLSIKGSPYSHEIASEEGLDSARNNVQHSSNTLTSLGLTHCSFTLYELSTVLDLLAREEGGLKSLMVNIQVLSPQMLDMLAEKLPRLERLEVDFSFLRATDVPTKNIFGWKKLTREDIEAFLIEMNKRSYSGWALRSFRIGFRSVKPHTVMAILMPLTMCFPHLLDIDGRYVKMWRVGSTWNASEHTDNAPVVPQIFKKLHQRI